MPDDSDREHVAGGVTPLSQLPGHRVAEGDPDVRGWEVVANDGRAVGRVRDLLVDVGAMKVRYLDVELAGDPLPAGRGSGELRQAAEPGLGDRGLGSPEAVAAPAIGEHLSGEERLAEASADAALRGAGAGPGTAATDRRVLIPLGYARVEEGADRVLLDRLRSTEVAALPGYDGAALDRAWEADLRRRLDRGWAPAAAEPEFYAHEHYDDARFYGARRHASQAGQLVGDAPDADATDEKVGVRTVDEASLPARGR
ncbi:MAG TPA: PRC-barrel domain-containing protein [Thermoanaerobaculia bacterium]|nr:PRC-barrel domain-containing protein [Thermoanaerobaculia bacterium]